MGVLRIPHQSWMDGDEREEFVPIDDRGMAMSEEAAAEVAGRFREALDELDQLHAFCRDFQEQTISWALLDVIKKIKERLKEVAE